MQTPSNKPRAKSVVLTYQTCSPEEFQRLTAVLRELAFENGDGWRDDLSRGAVFKTDIGALELIDGEAPCEAEILVEVTDLDAVIEVARRHELTITEPMATHWNSQIVIAELGALRIGFFCYAEQQREEAA